LFSSVKVVTNRDGTEQASGFQPGVHRMILGGSWSLYVQDKRKIAKCQSTFCRVLACKRRQIERDTAGWANL